MATASIESHRTLGEGRGIERVVAESAGQYRFFDVLQHDTSAARIDQQGVGQRVVKVTTCDDDAVVTRISLKRQ